MHYILLLLLTLLDVSHYRPESILIIKQYEGTHVDIF